MYFSIVCQIIILIFLDFLVEHSSQGTPPVVESNDTATWYEAKINCQQNGELTSFMDASYHKELQPGEFWFSGVHALSPWVWMRGCFNKTLLKIASVDSIQHSAGRCALKCNNSPYFTLDSLKLCYCLSEIEVQAYINSNMKISPQLCKMCGNDNCGEDKDSVFLYQKYKKNSPPFENLEQESNADLKCVTMKYNASYPENTTFFITDCNEEFNGVCITDEKDTYSIRAPETWFVTLDRCQNNLQGYPFDAEKLNQLSNVMQIDRIWIGLYREDTQILDEKIIMNGSLITTSCLYLKSADGGLEAPIQSDCNVTRRYLCSILASSTTRIDIWGHTSRKLSIPFGTCRPTNSEPNTVYCVRRLTNSQNYYF